MGSRFISKEKKSVLLQAYAEKTCFHWELRWFQWQTVSLSIIKHFLYGLMHVVTLAESLPWISHAVMSATEMFHSCSLNVIISSNTVQYHSLTPITLPGGYQNYSFSSVLMTPAAFLINQFNLGELDWDVSQMKKCNMRLITPSTFSE